MMRLIRKDRSFFIFRKPEQNDIDLTNKTLQTKYLTIDTGVFMKHYLENIDEVCRRENERRRHNFARGGISS